MAQVSGQDGKKRLNVLALAIPGQKSGAGKGMSQVMKARTRTALSTPQPTLIQCPAEGEVNVGVIQPVTVTGDEKGRFRGCRSKAYAFFEVALK